MNHGGRAKLRELSISRDRLRIAGAAHERPAEPLASRELRPRAQDRAGCTGNSCSLFMLLRRPCAGAGPVPAVLAMCAALTAPAPARATANASFECQH